MTFHFQEEQSNMAENTYSNILLQPIKTTYEPLKID